MACLIFDAGNECSNAKEVIDREETLAPSAAGRVPVHYSAGINSYSPLVSTTASSHNFNHPINKQLDLIVKFFIIFMAAATKNASKYLSPEREM